MALTEVRRTTPEIRSDEPPIFEGIRASGWLALLAVGVIALWLVANF